MFYLINPVPLLPTTNQPSNPNAFTQSFAPQFTFVYVLVGTAYNYLVKKKPLGTEALPNHDSWVSVAGCVCVCVCVCMCVCMCVFVRVFVACPYCGTGGSFQKYFLAF